MQRRHISEEDGLNGLKRNVKILAEMIKTSNNDHYGQNGRLAIWPIMAILTIMAIQAIFAIMIIIARYGCQKERLCFRNAVTGNLTT